MPITQCHNKRPECIRLYLYFLPVPLSKPDNSDNCEHHLGQCYGKEYSQSSHFECDGRQIGKGQLEHPKGNKIYFSWGLCIPCPIEGLGDNHTIGIEYITCRNDLQTEPSIFDNDWIIIEPPYNIMGEEQIY